MKQERSITGTPVIWRDVPLVGKPKTWAAPEGLSLLEIVKQVPELPPYFEEVGFIAINGEIVPRELWSRVRPKAGGGCHVNLLIELQGSSSSSKIISTVATVAVIVAAAFAGPEVAGLLGFTAGTPAFLATQAAVSAAVAVGGSLLISALAPPPSLGGSASGSTRTSTIKTAALQGNTIGAGDSLSRVIGYRRVFPQLVCPPVIELIENTEVIEGVYGLAGPHQIDNVYAGDVNLATMQEVTFVVSDGFLNSQPQGLINRQGFVATPNTILSNYVVSTTSPTNLRDQDDPIADVPFYHGFQTRFAPDEFWLSLAWNEGLLNTSGNPTACPVRAQIRVLGTTTWTLLPEIHFRNKKPNQFQQTIKLMWQKAPTVKLDPDNDNGVWTVYYSVPGQTAKNPVTSGYTADSYFYDGVGDTYWENPNTATTGLLNCQPYRDRIEIYLDPAIFPQALYEIQIVRGQVFKTNNWNQSTYKDSGPTGTAIVFDLFGYWMNGTTAVVNYDQTTFKSDITIIRGSSIWNEPPVSADAGIALIAVKSTGRSLQSLSCDAGGYVSMTLAGQPDSFQTSSNPADHYYDVLTNITLGAFPLQAFQVDDLTQFRADCDANGYTINTIIQGMKQMDVLNLIASAGFARPIQCETWGVAEDKDRSALLPVQIFTPRNLQDFQWTRTFAPFIDGFRVKYDDATNLFIENEIVVLDPEAFTSGERLEDIRYETIVSQADATRRALFDLKQARRRLVFYSGTADIENLVCRRGDLVGVTHDILSSEVWAARVVSTITSGGNITGLNLDDTVPAPLFEFFNQPFKFFNDSALHLFNKPQRVGVCIRTTAGTMLVKEITSVGGNVSTISFVTPFTDPGTIIKDCLLTLGVLGSEIRRLIVQNIKPKADMVATLTFVDEAPDLWASKIVTLLLHMDGANGSTTFTDSSSYTNSIFNFGNATNSTTQQKFGTASGHFDGTANSALQAQAVSIGDVTVDFTVDFWVFPTSQTGTQTLFENFSGGSFQSYLVQMVTDGATGMNIELFSSSAGTSWDIANGTVVGNVQLNVWSHFAFEQLGDYLLIFVNGNLTFSIFNNLGLKGYAGNPVFCIGSTAANTQGYIGYIDEFRYTNGLARWTSSFNVPIVAGTP